MKEEYRLFGEEEIRKRAELLFGKMSKPLENPGANKRDVDEDHYWKLRIIVGPDGVARKVWSVDLTAKSVPRIFRSKG